jgi:hydroxylamine dehydrogenase
MLNLKAHLIIVIVTFWTVMASAETCVDCHRKINPNAVADWQLSKHKVKGVGCIACHGSDHTTDLDVSKAKTPTASACGLCHGKQTLQFMEGKHALGWASMKAMPTIHWQPMALIEGQKGCGGCHKIGTKTGAEIKALKRKGQTFGNASCDACHTRHTFSVQEARQPQSCQTCHMGFDHPQWEMYSGSKHGVRFLLKQNQILPEGTPAPSCQTCHMQEGDHGVRAAWGFLGVRLPMPKDREWAADRATILQALGVLDPKGKPTARLKVVKAADIARLTQEEWQKDRDKMLKTCNQCHSINFARNELNKGDQMIKKADHLMAEGIRTVSDLYKDGFLLRPKTFSYPFPDLLTFFDAPSVIEQKLFVMFLEHRMRTFQGTFHANPDYALWYGWGAMKKDLTEIKALAADLRERAGQSARPVQNNKKK